LGLEFRASLSKQVLYDFSQMFRTFCCGFFLEMGESLKVEKRKKKWKKMEKKMESPWNVRFHKSKERFFFFSS
jgi:hypothetical protein